jgi:hypothetical protein
LRDPAWHFVFLEKLLKKNPPPGRERRGEEDTPAAPAPKTVRKLLTTKTKNNGRMQLHLPLFGG